MQEQNDDKQATGNSCNCSSCTLKPYNNNCGVKRSVAKKVKSARIDLGSRRRRRGRATNWFCRGSRQQAGRVTEAARRPLPLPFIRCQHQLKQPASERATSFLPLSHSPSLSVCLSLCGKIYEQRSVVTTARCAPAPMPMLQQPQMEMKMKLATQTPQLSRSFDFDLP